MPLRRRVARAALAPVSSTCRAPTSVPSSTMSSLYSPKQQGDIALKSACCKRMFQVFQIFQLYVIKIEMLHMLKRLYMYVLSVCSKRFICFRRMLQLFHLDVAKLDWDVAYICKCFMCFHMYVASVSF
jgi:hypothetical protein